MYSVQSIAISRSTKTFMLPKKIHYKILLLILVLQIVHYIEKIKFSKYTKTHNVII